MNDFFLNRKTSKGFSLIEVLVVIGLLLILFGIALPAFRNYQPNLHLSGSARNLASDLRSVQESAVAEQIVYGIVFYPSEKKYEIKKFGQTPSLVRTVSLPSQIQSMTITQDIINNGNTIKYNPYGSVDVSGDVTLHISSGKTATVSIKASGFVVITN